MTFKIKLRTPRPKLFFRRMPYVKVEETPGDSSPHDVSNSTSTEDKRAQYTTVRLANNKGNDKRSQPITKPSPTTTNKAPLVDKLDRFLAESRPSEHLEHRRDSSSSGSLEVTATDLSEYTDSSKPDQAIVTNSSTVDIHTVPEHYSAFEYIRHVKHATLPSRTRRDLQEKWNQDYTSILLNSGNIDREITLHLAASYHLLDEFEYIGSNINDDDHFRFASSLLESIFWTLEDFLYPRIADLFYDRMDKLSQEQVAELVCFMHDFNSLAINTIPDFDSTKRWDADRLFSVYRKRIDADMDVLINALAVEYTREENIRQTNDKEFLVADLAPQLAFLLEHQRDVMMGSLPTKYHSRVTETCSAEISRLAAALLDIVKSTEYQKGAGVHQYCALINECFIITEIIDGFFDDSTEEIADPLATLWTQLSLTLVTQLVNHIMDVLHDKDEHIFSSVGRSNWTDVGARIAATLSDYLSDLQVWLSNTDYFVPRILAQCLDRCLQDYLTAFFTHSVEGGVENATTAASLVRQDRDVLVDYFTQDGSVSFYHGMAGFLAEDKIRQKLSILKHIANLMDTDVEPLFAQEDVIAIQKQFDSDKAGSPTILHLIGLRKQHASDESAEWLRVIAKAKKEIERENESDPQLINEDLSSSAPNIRESRFLHRIETGHRVERRLSKATMSYVASSRHLQSQQAKGFNRLKTLATSKVQEQLMGVI